METNQTLPARPVLTQEQMLAAIYEHTRKTMAYMKWQLYITLILVVLPLLSLIILIPLMMKSLGSIYGGGSVLYQ